MKGKLKKTPNAIMFDFLECASFRHGIPGGWFWDIIRRPCVNEVSQMDPTLRRCDHPSQKFPSAEAWSPDNEHRHALHGARKERARGVAFVSPMGRSGRHKLTLKQCVVRSRSTPHARAEAGKRRLEPPVSVGRVNRPANRRG
jgi:hypothetical protein